MNNVHELGPNGDSKTALSRKLGRKLSRVHKTPNWPSWAHRRAQARACLAVSWALRQCRGPRPCRRMSCRVAGAPASYRGRSAAHASAVSWACVRAGMAYRGLPCDTLPSLKLPFLSQYIVLYCNAIPAKPDCCNTIYCIAIQSTLYPPKATLSRYT